jgi:ABC-2 type transport system permease protein
MISPQAWAVIRREINDRRGKGFIFGTILIPFILGLIVGVQILLANLKSEDPAYVTIVLENNSSLQALLTKAFDQSDAVKKKMLHVSYQQIAASGVDAYIKSQQEALVGDNNKSVVVVPDSALKDKKVGLYSANTANMEARRQITAGINKALITSFFAQNNIQNVDVGYIQSDVGVTASKVSKRGTRVEGWGPIIVAWGLPLLLLFGVSFNAPPLMSIVVGEKASRVYELLLSSLKPRDLMWGKVIGAATMACVQMVIWVACFIALVLLMNNFGDVSDSLRIEVRPFVLMYYMLNYLIGLLIFLTLYGGLSAMYDNPSAANATLGPVYMIILLPFYTTFSLLGNPANRVVEILSMAPLTSLYVMPARMTLVDVPAWQGFVALAVNSLVLYFAITVAGKVYRLSILSTGNMPSLRQMAIWARHA